MFQLEAIRKQFSSGSGRQGGFALIGVILVLALLTILGGGVFMSSIMDSDISANKRAATEAFYVAEAGIQRAIGELAEDSQWAATVGNPENAFDGDNALGTSIYIVEVFDNDPASGWVRVRSTGETSGNNPARYTVEGRIEKEGELEYPPILDWAAFTCNNMDWTGENTFIKGPVYSGGNFTLKGGTNTIQGDVYADGNLAVEDQGQVTGNTFSNGDLKAECNLTPCIDGDATAGGNLSGENKITGSTAEKVSPAPVEDLCDPSKLHQSAITGEQIQDWVDNADTTFSGGKNFKDEAVTLSGVVVLENGDLHLSGNIEMTENTIFIVENGNVTIEGPASISGAQATFIVRNGNLHVYGAVDLNGVVQVGEVWSDGNIQGGNIDIQDNSSFHVNGSAVALNGNFHMSDNLQINHTDPSDPQLSIGDGAAGISVRFWRDVRE